MSVDGGWGDSDRCVAVAGGWSHSLAVTACGKAFGWGCGADGRIGVGCYSDQLRPSLIYLYNNMFDDRDDEIGEDDGDPGSKRQVDPDEELAYSLKERERPVREREVSALPRLRAPRETCYGILSCALERDEGTHRVPQNGRHTYRHLQSRT